MRRSEGSRRFVSPAVALLPLRLFLGVTFVYAGVQKLGDPGFLHAGAPTYIGTQLEGFAGGTPARRRRRSNRAACWKPTARSTRCRAEQAESEVASSA